jgi:23S rRNA (cytosine1962-C5)-methyltransferase
MQHPPSHCFLKDCIADRENIFGKVPSSECLRWVHHEGPQFRMDQFGEVLWVYWYSENEPTIQERQQLNEFAQQRNLKIEIRMMFNRGGPIRPTSPSIESAIPEKWIAAENQTRYEFRRDQGLSPGLFLDQRYNRYWVRKNATDKSVLNLFAYTGGFSVNAALGKAKEVCTVDLSKNFIEWSKINFQLNGLDSQRFEFRVSDCLGFLRSLSKKDRKFDLIIVDPPSFSRSKDGVFRIEKDWKSLLDLALSCLTQNGEILFSTNFEKMNTAEWARVLRTWAMSHKKDIMEMPSSLDCDRPGRRNESLLKSFLIR